jgi:hypothetical protein
VNDIKQRHRREENTKMDIKEPELELLSVVCIHLATNRGSGGPM